MGLTATLIVLSAWTALLFAVAFYGDARAKTMDASPARRAWLYALGLGVYCTSWTFYGAVGAAARDGWDYLPIYLGPALLFVFGFFIVRRLVRLGREHDTGSIADFLSARYGKSAAVGALAAGGLLLAVIPYIALQLKSAASSLSLVTTGEAGGAEWGLPVAVAFAGFAILFGQRKADAALGNRGLVLAVALESAIKLIAMLAVGVFAWRVWVATPEAARAGAIAASPLFEAGFDFRFAVITLLAGFAALTLPRQFHMMVVEARRPDDARLSRWAFPAYLALVAVTAPPVALAGAAALTGADPDAYVLALPLALGADGLALLAFIGGFSAAAGMVTVAALAMSTMLVNDIAAPLLLRAHGAAARRFASSLLVWRRLAVVVLVGAAFAFQLGMDRSMALAGIGLVAFAGAAQLAPALLFGLFWRRANRAGALAGMTTGFTLWLLMILIPSYAGLSPPAPAGVDPFAFAALVSLCANALAFIVAVAFFEGGLIDRLQADAFTGGASAAGQTAPGARIADVETVLARVLGAEEARRAMDEIARAVGRPMRAGDSPTSAVTGLAEARLARAVGAASARILMTRVIGGSRVSAGEVVALIDETAEKLRTSHDRLEESERSIRFYTDNLPALLSYADRDYRLRFANRGYLDFFGLDESAIGKPMASFMSPADYALRRPHMEAALSGERQVFDISRKQPGGRRRSWQLVYQPRIEDGEVVGFFGVYQDNTARREAEVGLKRAYETLETRVEERTAALKAESEARLQLAEDLEQARAAAEAATQSKTRFLAAASHDLLQPLSAARLFAGALEAELEEDGPRDTARRIERAIDHADKLLRALLDISRLDAGGVTPRPTVFSLGELIEETAAQFTPAAKAKGLTLKVMPCRLAVFTDRGLMTSVVQNLISNAVRYTQSGTVLVGARRSGKEVRLQVIDTGPGVPEARRAAIFREFERGAMASSEDRGLGLGLAVVDRICKSLGHKLILRSEVGAGSVFEVRLPRAKAKPGAARPARRTAASLEGLKVLCLDDEPPVLDAMVALLQRWGCDARGARDRDGAVRAFNGTAPDAVLVDYRLADADTGPAVYEALCAHWNARPPGLLITAERGEDARADAAASGLDLLAKPAPPAVLRASLASLKGKAG
ncbi:MAG: sodium:solute symporter family transporter [Oceanicaulis sp.]